MLSRLVRLGNAARLRDTGEPFWRHSGDVLSNPPTRDHVEPETDLAHPGFPRGELVAAHLEIEPELVVWPPRGRSAVAGLVAT
jgi:hypothetical protein